MAMSLISGSYSLGAAGVAEPPILEAEVEKLCVEEAVRDGAETEEEGEKLVVEAMLEPRGAATRTPRGCKRRDLDADLMLRLTADMIPGSQSVGEPRVKCLCQSVVFSSC